MRFKGIILLILTTIFFGLGGCQRPNRLQSLKYKRQIAENRARKDKAFKLSQNSPIPVDKRWSFKHLNYYPIDSSYRVKADFEEIRGAQELTIMTSTGVGRVYKQIGIFSFTLHGTSLKLHAYQEKPTGQYPVSDALFVPFSDRTTGRDTYGGGRYLDIEKPKGSQAVIDFNLAYNPYCAYNHNYSCPIPPMENHLDLAVEAGERL